MAEWQGAMVISGVAVSVLTYQAVMNCGTIAFIDWVHDLLDTDKHFYRGYSHRNSPIYRRIRRNWLKLGREISIMILS